jgi:hypothetical protein
MTAKLIEVAGTVGWSNGVDLDPDVMYEKSELFRQNATG